MGRTADGAWAETWTPPTYTVDQHGKVVGAVNDRTPNNWGRWGELDERGTVNFITPQMVADAAALVRTGRAISCAIPLDSQGPVHPSRPGLMHFYGYTGADHVAGSVLGRRTRTQATDDYLLMPLQGSTQWDGLAHIGSGDMLYNGFWIGNVQAYDGARRCSVHQLKDRLVGRGVLLDLPGHQGVDRLRPGHGITPEQLDACAQAQGVEIRTGDILLVRTGHVPWFYALKDKSKFWAAGAPGVAMSTVEWFHAREIAALAMDNVAVEVEPFEDASGTSYPVHNRLIRDLGLTLGEIWWLEELAEACAEEDRWEFLLSAAPLNVTNASGSPLNPLAVL
ncbi:cyclase family protein [Streptomyces melanosporofaciens]|uniref:Putative cyclase n=1 Tax=Streptomyces melanosporofaciens TaxID=67327 RepID=A0A1H4KNG8_STRMJ|nr:cyclase family protein [Streptomyces melanosporofaciens]SEB59645.1 Putative cyclase [Streptomyces melanosporofaciens]